MFTEMKSWLVLAFSFILLSGCVCSLPEKLEQGVIIQGTVFDSKVNPLARVKVKTYLYTGVYLTGVSITEEFKEYITDDNGQFRILMTEGYSIEIYVEDSDLCWFSPGVTVGNQDYFDGKTISVSLNAGSGSGQECTRR